MKERVVPKADDRRARDMIEEIGTALIASAVVVACLTGCAPAFRESPREPYVENHVARRFADELIGVVEDKGFPPTDHGRYAAARAALLDYVRDGGEWLPRAELYRSARKVLAELDADGHTILWTLEESTSWYSSTRPESAASESAARLRKASAGHVLVVTPPQATFVDRESQRAYQSNLVDAIRSADPHAAACGLVVDLIQQRGGNAWPPLFALRGLLTAENSARWIDRDGKRTPILAPSSDSAQDPLHRFAGHAFAIRVGAQTASAGEMLAIVLRGESQARWFGSPTYGATTGNVMVALPDSATLLLSTVRYGFGTDTVLRGRLLPDFLTSDSDAALDRAIEWAATNSGFCPP